MIARTATVPQEWVPVELVKSWRDTIGKSFLAGAMVFPGEVKEAVESYTKELPARLAILTGQEQLAVALGTGMVISQLQNTTAVELGMLVLEGRENLLFQQLVAASIFLITADIALGLPADTLLKELA